MPANESTRHATASWRCLSVSRSRSGWCSQWRIRRLPMPVAHSSSSEKSVRAGARGGDGRDRGERLALGLAGIFEERAARADGERHALDAEAGECAGAKLLQELALARLEVEMPRRQARQEIAVEHDAIGDQHLRGRDAPQLILQRL